MKSLSTMLPNWMKKAVKPITGLVLLAIFAAWAGGFFREKTEPGAMTGAPGFPLPPGAETITAEIEQVAPRIDVVGTITSEETTHLSSRISAYVRSVHASAGSTVSNGQVLITMDDRDAREQITSAEASLAQAETEFNRTKQLFGRQATTEQSMIAAESAYRSAKAEAERSRVRMTDTRIVSPINGVVTERRVEPGDLATPGQVLLSVYNPDRMRLEAPVPMRLVERLQLDQSVEIELDRPAITATGVVSEIVGEVDPRSRTQHVKVRLQMPDGPVLPGTFGRLWVKESPRPAMLIPSTSIYRVGQLEMVNVVRGTRVLLRSIKTGPAREGRVEILSGLKPGDVILVEPITEIR